jgi:hypothetical protein
MAKKKKFKSVISEMNWAAGSSAGLMTIGCNRAAERVGIKKKKEGD